MRKRIRKNADGEMIKPRQVRWGFMIMWAVLLGAIIVVVTGILPGGRPVLKLSGRSERRRLASAGKMEKEQLWLAASEAYQSIVADPKISSPVRSQAADRLAVIYTDKIPDEGAAVKAAEGAYFYAEDPKEKHRLEARLGALRKKTPALEAPAAAPSSTTTTAAAPVAPEPSKPQTPSPAGTTVIAHIGADTVTLEDILYAYSRSKPKQQPSGDDLEKHAINYLNQALLAVEARRRAKDQTDGYQLELRYFERQLLAQSLLADVAPKKADDAATRKYYDDHLDKFQEPSSALLRHILLKTKDEADAVGKRLAEGEDFAKLAGEVSVDHEQLPDGGLIGRFHEGEDFIPYIGSMPSLMNRLLKLDDGKTSGPIQSARGFHFFRIEQKKASSPRPFEQVADRAAKEARTELLKKGQEDLLAELRKKTPVQIDEKAMKEGFERLQKHQPQDSAAPQEGPPAPAPSPSQP